MRNKKRRNFAETQTERSIPIGEDEGRRVEGMIEIEMHEKKELMDVDIDLSFRVN